jgi:PadR family transcriptional regulator AphA
MVVGRELTPGEWSVLALLADHPAHGWALAKEMSRTGEVGRVWAVGRPLVYRALELLESRGLIERAESERGARGPNRTLFHATGTGREALARWLSEPVDHVREVRSLFVLKLVLIDRAGLDSRPLLEAQRAITIPAITTLERRLRGSAGAEEVFLRFRLETTRSVIHFIDGLLERRTTATSPASSQAASSLRKTPGSE